MVFLFPPSWLTRSISTLSSGATGNPNWQPIKSSFRTLNRTSAAGLAKSTMPSLLTMTIASQFFSIISSICFLAASNSSLDFVTSVMSLIMRTELGPISPTGRMVISSRRSFTINGGSSSIPIAVFPPALRSISMRSRLSSPQISVTWEPNSFSSHVSSNDIVFGLA